jgi:hypothetical protein
MVLIDRALGSRAEFLNAWSVVERLLGRSPSSEPSVVASRIGAGGELVVVVVLNLLVGFLLAALIRFLLRVL